MKTESANASVLRKHLLESSAWGQLIVGSVISGCSVWRLWLQATHSGPSKILAALAITYDQMRDFLTLPLLWFHLDLTIGERNLLTICLVLAAALLRTLYRYRGYIVVVSVVVVVVLVINQLSSQRRIQDVIEAFGLGANSHWIIPLSYGLAFSSVVIPLIILTPHFVSYAPWFRWPKLAMPTEDVRAASFVLLNVVAAIGWGAALLLLNSVT